MNPRPWKSFNPLNCWLFYSIFTESHRTLETRSSSTRYSRIRAARALCSIRLAATREMVAVVMLWAAFLNAEGNLDRGLALLGLARRQPAWNSNFQRELDGALAEWALDPAVVEAGLAKGADLDWDATFQELLHSVR